MFTQMKLYIYGAVAGLIAILFGWGKYQSSKASRLESENDTLTATNKATTEQAAFKESVISTEQDKIETGVKNSESKTKFDRLNDL